MNKPHKYDVKDEVVIQYLTGGKGNYLAFYNWGSRVETRAEFEDWSWEGYPSFTVGCKDINEVKASLLAEQLEYGYLVDKGEGKYEVIEPWINAGMVLEDKVLLDFLLTHTDLSDYRDQMLRDLT